MTLADEIMRRLAADLVDGTDNDRRTVVLTVDIERDPCGCSRARVTHAAALADALDGVVARTLLRREYDRRAGRPMASLAAELDIGVAGYPLGDPS